MNVTPTTQPSSGPPASGPVPSATTLPVPSPSPSAGPLAVDAAAWYPVSLFPDVLEDGPTTMSSVAATWFGYLGVGWTPRGGMSWWSADGRSWTAALHPDPSLRNARLTGVAASDTRIVAIGQTVAINGAAHAEIWTSSDGLAWKPTLRLPAESFATVDAIVRSHGVFVAVGSGDDETPVRWSSTDGAAWTETNLPDAATRLADGPAGVLVTGGEPDIADGTPSTAMLITPSGVTPTSLPPGRIDLIAGAPNAAYWAFAAPAADSSSSSAVYRSSDASTWTRVADLPAASHAAAALPQPDGSILVTTQSDETGATDGILRLVGGSAWQAVTWPSPLETGSAITAFAAGSAGIVGVGAIGDRRIGAWFGQPAGANPPEPPQRDPVATGCPTKAALAAAPRDLLSVVVRVPAESRPRCFGSATLRVAGFLAEPDGLGGTCGATASPEWLTGGCPSYPDGWLQPLAAPYLQTDDLDLYARSTLAPALKQGHWVLVSGHFDDPLSSTCRLIGPEPGQLAEPIATSVKECRQHFVVTSVASSSAPPAPAVDPASNLGLPDADQLAPAFEGWDNLALPAGTVYGFRAVTPAAGSAITVTVFAVPTLVGARGVANALTANAGTPTSSVVGGVTVTRTSAGTQAVFLVGARVFRLEITSGDAGPTASQLASLDTVIQDLVRAAIAA